MQHGDILIKVIFTPEKKPRLLQTLHNFSISMPHPVLFPNRANFYYLIFKTPLLTYIICLLLPYLGILECDVRESFKAKGKRKRIYVSWLTPMEKVVCIFDFTFTIQKNHLSVKKYPAYAKCLKRSHFILSKVRRKQKTRLRNERILIWPQTGM